MGRPAPAPTPAKDLYRFAVDRAPCRRALSKGNPMILHDPFDLRAHVPSAPAARPTPAAPQVPARPGARHPRIPCPGASSWSERAPALTSLVAACGGRGDPLARHLGRRHRRRNHRQQSAVLLQRDHRRALGPGDRARGHDRDTQYQIDQREIYLPELESGAISVLPEYGGTSSSTTPSTTPRTPARPTPTPSSKPPPRPCSRG